MLAKEPAKGKNMISVKKVGDTIISKSVLPASTPQLNIAKANAEIERLKKQLAHCTSTAGDNSPQPATPAVSDTPHARKALLAEMKQYQDKFSLADYSLPPEVIRAKMALLRAEEDYSVVQTKAKNAVAKSEIEKQIYANTARTFTGEVFYLPKMGYYICYDVFSGIGRVYIKKDTEPGNAKFRALIHRRTGYNEKGNANVVLQSSIVPITDLTRQEFDAILVGKPMMEDLTKVYRLYDNTTLTINIDKVSPVY